MENEPEQLHRALHRALSILVKPADESSKGELNDILEQNIQDAMKELKLDSFDDMKSLHAIKCNVSATSSVRWKFVCVTLHVLMSMQATALLANSVSQQKTVRTCLQFVVSMGLLPSLLPGVGVAFAARCSSAPCLKEEELLQFEKYERLAAVTRGLLVCAENRELRQTIVAHHLGDLVAALCQLGFVPLKKPVDPSATRTDDFVMTSELWSRLQEQRTEFCSQFLNFINNLYAPLIIRELLILHGATGLKKLQNCARTNPPVWLKKTCIMLLVRCVMRSKGVSSLIRAICESDPDTGNDWAKIDTVVNLVTTVHTTDPDKYYRNVCGQLMEILQDENRPAGSVGQLQLIVALRCVEVLYKNAKDVVHRKVVDVILEPLRMCCLEHCRKRSGGSNRELELVGKDGVKALEEAVRVAVRRVLDAVPTDRVTEQPSRTKRTRRRKQSEENETAVVSEESLSLCVLHMHRLFAEPASGRDEPPLPPDAYASYTPVLFALYRKIYSSPCHYKSQVENLLSRVLCSFEPEVFGGVFRSFIFGERAASDKFLQMDPRLELCFGPGGAVEVRERDGPVAPLDSDTAAECVFELLSNADQTGEIATGLFLALLRIFFEPVKDDQTLANAGKRLESRFKIPVDGDVEKSAIAAEMLSTLSESHFVREKISTDPNYLIQYVFFMLEQEAKQLSERVEADESMDEHLFVVLMILSIAVTTSADGPLEETLFQGIAEPIKMIRDKAANEEIRHMASRIYNKMATRGIVDESTVGEEQIPTCSVAGKARDATPSADDRSRTAYLEAMVAAHDVSVPVRGHGIVELTRLLLKGDKEVRRHKEDVFLIFKEGLNHEDSYIYLSSVNGLSALAATYPDTVIHTLIGEYVNRGRDRGKDSDKWTKIRLKIGEVLVQVTKTLGDMVPLYKDALLNAFLSGAKDSDGLVRASSLSNLGTLCAVMKYRVDSVVHEIFSCIQSIVQSDPMVEVRRAAIVVLKLLLEGLGEDALSVLQDVLLDLYRVLKKVYSIESDEILKLHAEGACDVLSKLTVDFITRTPKLEKRICISGFSNI